MKRRHDDKYYYINWVGVGFWCGFALFVTLCIVLGNA